MFFCISSNVFFNLFLAELVGLLKWRLKPDDVVTALTSVLKVEAKEIVKVANFN